MGYNKFISYGNNLEVYEYEKNIYVLRGAVKRPEKPVYNPDMGADGANPLPERKLGKRQDNARRASMVFRRLVSSNLSRVEFPLLITITYADNQTDIRQGYKDFTSFIQALRYKFGKNFRYISVPEFQKRGAVHFHALFWGLPFELFLSERKTRFLASLWGKGFVYMKETDGNEKLSFYLAKYMAKAFMDDRLKNQKAYVASRNCLRPYIVGGIENISWLIDDYIGTDIVAEIKEKRFMTEWLGECRFRHFRLEPILE